MAANGGGWETVTDPSEAQTVSSTLQSSLAPSGGASKLTPQDRKLLNDYRSAGDAGDTLLRSADAFVNRAQRFHTGPAKAALFGAMYPEEGGILGPLKSAGAAVLRGTVGYLYPSQDHDDYQYLNSRASSLNNAALRLEKGVQTKSDEVRIARENIGVDKTPQVDRDILQANMDNAYLAHARALSASKWAATFGSLTGTHNAHGLTYDQWYERVVKPNALAASRNAKAPRQTQPQGWSIQRIK